MDLLKNELSLGNYFDNVKVNDETYQIENKRNDRFLINLISNYIQIPKQDIEKYIHQLPIKYQKNLQDAIYIVTHLKRNELFQICLSGYDTKCLFITRKNKQEYLVYALDTQEIYTGNRIFIEDILYLSIWSSVNVKNQYKVIQMDY